jgi:hypothetical protein
MRANNRYKIGNTQEETQELKAVKEQMRDKYHSWSYTYVARLESICSLTSWITKLIRGSWQSVGTEAREIWYEIWYER